MWNRVRLLWIAHNYPPEHSPLNILPKDIIGEISLALSRNCISFNKLLSIKNNQGYTALELAMKSRASTVLSHLVSPFTVNNIQNAMGSPLHFAADSGSTAACRLLLSSGCEINKRNHRGETGLYRACCTYPENEECVQVFLDFGADPFIQDNHGKTALNMAESRKYFSCAKRIKLYEQKFGK